MKYENLALQSGLAQASILRAVRNRRFERMPDGGLLLPTEGVIARGTFVHALNGGPLQYDHNMVVPEGLDYLLNTGLNNQTPASQWYVALFSGDVEPQGSWNASNFAATATEFTDYDQTERPAFTSSEASGGVLDNFANETEFTINASGTVYGGAIISASGKGDNTGILFSAAFFENGQRDVQATDVLKVAYQITLTSTG